MFLLGRHVQVIAGLIQRPAQPVPVRYLRLARSVWPKHEADTHLYLAAALKMCRAVTQPHTDLALLGPYRLPVITYFF